MYESILLDVCKRITCVLVEVRRSIRSLGSGATDSCGAPWLLGTGREFFPRAARALYHCTISPAAPSPFGEVVLLHNRARLASQVPGTTGTHFQSWSCLIFPRPRSDFNISAGNGNNGTSGHCTELAEEVEDDSYILLWTPWTAPPQ